MQAITVHYLPATETKGARYKAKCQSGSYTTHSTCDSSADELRAAEMLVQKLGWNVDLIDAGVMYNHTRVYMIKYRSEV